MTADIDFNGIKKRLKEKGHIDNYPKEITGSIIISRTEELASWWDNGVIIGPVDKFTFQWEGGNVIGVSYECLEDSEAWYQKRDGDDLEIGPYRLKIIKDIPEYRLILAERVGNGGG